MIGRKGIKWWSGVEDTHDLEEGGIQCEVSKMKKNVVAPSESSSYFSVK